MPAIGPKPERLVEMAFALLDLANSLNPDEECSTFLGDAENVPSNVANSVQSIDEMGPLLASIANIEYRARTYRNTLLGGDLFGEPAWDMLLDLFIRGVEGKKTPVTSLCIASRVPSTTALRYISEMEKRGLIVRAKSGYDQRTSYLSLSAEAFVKIGTYLRRRYSAAGFPRSPGMREAGLVVDPQFVDQG